MGRLFILMQAHNALTYFVVPIIPRYRRIACVSHTYVPAPTIPIDMGDAFNASLHKCYTYQYQRGNRGIHLLWREMPIITGDAFNASLQIEHLYSVTICKSSFLKFNTSELCTRSEI